MYAITLGNVVITGYFVCLTAGHIAVGIYLAVLAATTPGMTSISVVPWAPALDIDGLVCRKPSATTPFAPPLRIQTMCHRR